MVILRTMFRKVLDFFLFSSLFISCCATLMVYQTIQLVPIEGNTFPLYSFVFFSTICSYNTHWYFTPLAKNERSRSVWTQKHMRLQLFLAIAGAISSFCFLPYFLPVLHWILPAVLLTFLYTAPKIPLNAFRFLKKLAIGKTIYLAVVWTYVTAAMPLLLYEVTWTGKEVLFCLARLFFVYAVCILFDYRDREQDRMDGIRSLVTYFEEKGINRLFAFSLVLFAVFTILLSQYTIPYWQVIVMLLPGLMLASLFQPSKRNFSDYLYYLVLDGLMMFSSLCMLLLSI